MERDVQLATRPRFVLESREDEVYHDQSVGARATEPEYYAFLGHSWVFNRRMRWLPGPGDTRIAYSDAGDLALTGEGSASEWFSDPANRVVQRGGRLYFARRSGRQRDCVVLPGFQFEVERYPLARLEVTHASADWQLCVFVKGRSGLPLVASPWQVGAGSLSLEVGRALWERGYHLHYAELHFVFGLWSPSGSDPAEAEFSLTLPGSAAVVPCLPVVRTCGRAQSEGVPVSALVLDDDGKVLGADHVTVVALWDGRRFPMAEQDGIWATQLLDVPVGDHAVRLVAQGAVQAESDLSVRLTQGRFWAYDPDQHLLTAGGTPLGPLNGSYQGLVYVRDAGTPHETLVQGQGAYEGWAREQPPGEHWHYWEALTGAELEDRFAYLAANGWNLAHLSQHWAIWEKLDAGGHIAPHGAEQVALYYRTAARHGLGVVQALSHYPYGSGAPDEAARHCTPVFRQYLEAGFRSQDWMKPDSAFTQHFYGYLSDYVTLFRDEDAIAALTTSGEGDYVAGPGRVNDTCRFVRQHDPHHLFLAEPIHRLEHLPAHYTAGWEQPLFGSRLYWIGEDFEPELDLGIEFKLNRLGPVYTAEGSWPCPPLYSEFHDQPRTWQGTPEYRTRVRDTFYLGLIYRMPILLTWEEQLTEDEHRLFGEIRQAVDWSQPFAEAPIAIRISDAHVRAERRVLRDYEEVFSAWPVATSYLLPGALPPASALAVLDAREPFARPSLRRDGGAIPDEVEGRMPLAISGEYRATYAWSADRRTLLAYVYNCAGHLQCDYRHCIGGRFHRQPRPAFLRIGLRHFAPAPLRVQVFDLTAKAIVGAEHFSERTEFDLGRTAADVFVLVTPA